LRETHLRLLGPHATEEHSGRRNRRRFWCAGVQGDRLDQRGCQALRVLVVRLPGLQLPDPPRPKRNGRRLDGADGPVPGCVEGHLGHAAVPA
jgi:hypothetical protein